MKFYGDVVLQDVEPVNFIDIPYGDMEAWHSAVDKTLKNASYYYDRKLTTKMKDMGYAGDNSTVSTPKFQVRVADIPMGFDIETTTVVDRDVKGKVVSARGYMYYGCVGIGETIVHCRTWEQVMDVFRYFTDKGNLGIKNAHRNVDKDMTTVKVVRTLDANLGFEFYFMCKKMEWQEGFLLATTTHDVIYALSTDGLLFQDPLKISNSSLEDLAKMYHLPTQKTHELDYKIPRNSKTPLTAEEKHYVSCDVRILLDFARWCHKNYTKNGLRIPLTQTAILRDTIRRHYENYRKTHFEFVHDVLPKLFPADVRSYTCLTQKMFRGGYTHANFTGVGETFHKSDNIEGWDIDSSYVFSILCQKFPMSEWKLIDRSSMSVEVVEKLASTTAFTMHVRFKGLLAKSDLALESMSKTEEYEQAGRDFKEYKRIAGAVIDNGRIRYADTCTVYLTELDLLNYLMFYTWESIEFGTCYYAAKDYLPEYVRYPLMQNYLKKSVLKHTGKKNTTEYVVAKASVNAGFGLMVEKMKFEQMVYADGEFKSDRPTDEQVKGKEKLYLKRLSEIYQNRVYRTNSKGEDLARNPLSPFWGIWVSAHARHNLLTVVHRIGDDHLYCDTDSVYTLNYEKHVHKVEEYNAIVRDTTRIVFAKWNEEHPDAAFDYQMFEDLGTFGYENKDEDGNPVAYKRFKTLGAKRYLKETDDGEIEQVLAGLPKGTLVEYAKKIGKDPFEIFTDGLKIPNAKKCCKYIPRPTVDVIVDKYGNAEIMAEDSSVAIFDVDFSLSFGSDYVALLQSVLETKKRTNYLEPVGGTGEDGKKDFKE